MRMGMLVSPSHPVNLCFLRILVDICPSFLWVARPAVANGFAIRASDRAEHDAAEAQVTAFIYHAAIHNLDIACAQQQMLVIILLHSRLSASI